MSDRLRYLLEAFLILVILILCAVVFVRPSIVYSQANPIDLTKEEAVQLLKFQFQFESALQQRENYMVQLFTRYNLTQDQWKVDVLNGRFVPASVEQAKVQPEAPPKANK